MAHGLLLGMGREIAQAPDLLRALRVGAEDEAHPSRFPHPRRDRFKLFRAGKHGKLLPITGLWGV